MLKEIEELKKCLEEAVYAAKKADYWETHDQLIYPLYEASTGQLGLPATKEEFFRHRHPSWARHLCLRKAFSGDSIKCDPKVDEAIDKCLWLAVKANLTAVAGLLNKAEEKYPENLRAAPAPERNDRLSEQPISNQTSFNKNDKSCSLKFL